MHELNAELTRKALKFATQAHGKQKMLGTKAPYLLHLTSVMAEALGVISEPSFYESYDGFIDPHQLLVVSLLHDTLEDTDVTYNDIVKEFGIQVANSVKVLTKNMSLPRESRMEECMYSIVEIQDHLAAVVKCCDRIVNLDTPPTQWSPEKIQSYKAEAELIYSILVPRMYIPPTLVARFRDKIDSYGVTNA